MRPSASLSAWLASRSARERRVLTGGAIAAAGLLVVGLGLLPFARRWEDRRTALEMNADRVRRYEGLVAREGALRREVAERRRALASRGLVSGPTSAVAASNVQALLQDYARSSAVRLERVDVVSEAKVGDDGLAGVPVQVTAQGDIHGLVALLERVERGGTLLIVDELTVSRGAIRADSVEILAFGLRLRAMWAVPVGGGS